MNGQTKHEVLLAQGVYSSNVEWSSEVVGMPVLFVWGGEYNEVVHELMYGTLS